MPAESRPLAPTAVRRATHARDDTPMIVWGDVSADQADGFAPADEPETDEHDDEVGYGFGV